MSRLSPAYSSETAFTLRAGKRHQVVWFADYADDATRRVRDVLLRSIDRFEGMDIAFAVRFFPNGPQEKGGEIAARAAIAAAQQDRFADMHQALFATGHTYSRASIIELAQQLGLDPGRFETDLDSAETTDRLARDVASARASAAIPHTPMLFIEGTLFEGAWDDESILEAIERPLGVRIELASTSFFRWAASSGFVLVLATIAALAMVNLGFQESYERLRETSAGIFAGDWNLALSLDLWVNDALMACFFLLVGIEIKRELVDGELSDPKSAALPLIAALGGMIAPAAIYALINRGAPTVHGWGGPMATDIAFTLGILALLGSRVPTSIKVFVSALAIADDLGAIVVIALFYGHGFHLAAFIAAVIVFAVMLVLNAGRIYSRTPYIILGLLLWYFVYESGLHATLAGVLTAAAIPSRRSAHIEGVAVQAGKIFDYEIKRSGESPSTASVLQLQKIVNRLRDPGFHLQHRLESWSSYLILPLFAFFNTGLLIVGMQFDVSSPEVLGTIAGLVIGKPLGICLSVYAAMKLGIGRLSSEIDWQHLVGAGFLCGIGFTMSIFIASAAFEGPQLQSVKLSILIASLLAGSIGTAILLKRRSNGLS